MSTTRWSRPSDVPFPLVWRRFDGRTAMVDGKVPSFWIQDVTDDLMEDVISHMCDQFLRDETLTWSTRLREDPLALQELCDLWRGMIKQRVALVALTEGENGPIIAGCNITGVAYKADKGNKLQFQYCSQPMRTVLGALEYIGDKVDVYERYGVSEYMTAVGLSVHRSYRGQGIGIELLRARFDIGKAVGLKLTVTVFTAVPSQILAERIGMEVLAEVYYEDYQVDGKVVFPNVTTPSMKMMAKKI